MHKLWVLIFIFLTACASSQPTFTPLPQGDEIQVVLVPSEIVLGTNRFAVGIISAQGMVRDAQVHFRYFDLSNASAPQLESEADATHLQTDDGDTTIYAHEREFKRAGSWGVQVLAQLDDGKTFDKTVAFTVQSKTPTLKIGARVPALDTRTAASVNGDLTQLSSAAQPNPAFYRLTLAQAIASGKPTVLLFVTPAYCQTRFCAPAYDIATGLEKKYGDQVNFIHVEVYSGLPNPAARGMKFDPAMIAFGLTTEPWVYVIDASGIVTYRVEGMMTEAELTPPLESLLRHPRQK